MGRHKGIPNRSPEDRSEALHAFYKTYLTLHKGSPCSHCGKVPICGLVLPGFHEWVRRPGATLPALKEAIDSVPGLMCRSCLGKRSKRKPYLPALTEDNLNLVIGGAFLREAQSSVALDGGDSGTRSDATEELAARLEELGVRK